MLKEGIFFFKQNILTWMSLKDGGTDGWTDGHTVICIIMLTIKL